MPTATNFEQSSPEQPSSKKKFSLSDIRRRFSSFSPRNSVIFMKSDLEKGVINRNSSFFFFVKDDDDNSCRKKHQRSVSECIDYSYNKEKFEDIDFYDDFEEIQYTPIFTRNKSQMNLSSYEESTNEVILDKRKSLIRLAVRKFTGVKHKKKCDKYYQDGKTNPFE